MPIISWVRLCHLSLQLCVFICHSWATRYMFTLLHMVAVYCIQSVSITKFYILILLICVHLLGLSAPSCIRHSVVISNSHRNMPTATHINASDQSPGESVHEKSQSKKATSNPSHSPPIQWKCFNCNYVNYSDIAEAVYADSEDGARRCVNCALVNTKL